MKINKEGYRIIAISGLICLVLWGLLYYFLSHNWETGLLVICGAILVTFWLFIVAFFREPRRVKIHDPELVFSPCDGRVVVTEVVYEDEYIKEEMLQISIFMSVTKLEDGKKVLFRQVAGLIARRIVSYIKTGDKVGQNDVFGFIKFGSRIDVLVPKDSELVVEIGDSVIGSQTPLVRLKK